MDPKKLEKAKSLAKELLSCLEGDSYEGDDEKAEASEEAGGDDMASMRMKLSKYKSTEG